MHIDLRGPTQVSSLSVSCYYVTFIDDVTRKTWIYYIQNKSDVFDTFKKQLDVGRIETQVSSISNPSLGKPKQHTVVKNDEIND